MRSQIRARHAVGLARRPRLRVGGDLFFILLPVLMGLFRVDGARSWASASRRKKLGSAGRPAEDALVARARRPARCRGRPSRSRTPADRRAAAPRGAGPAAAPRPGGTRAASESWLASAARTWRSCGSSSDAALGAVELPLQGGLRLRRLGGAELRVDLEAERGGEAGRQTIRRQPLPVLHGAGVVAGVIRLEAAQQHLPLQKRRTQADALQRGAGVVVLAGLRLLEGRGRRGRSRRAALRAARRGRRPPAARRRRPREPVIRPAASGAWAASSSACLHLADLGQLRGDLLQPGGGRAVERQGGAKDRERRRGCGPGCGAGGRGRGRPDGRMS